MKARLVLLEIFRFLFGKQRRDATCVTSRTGPANTCFFFATPSSISVCSRKGSNIRGEKNEDCCALQGLAIPVYSVVVMDLN